MPIVNSTAIHRIDYDPLSRNLYITFNSDLSKRYTYFGVPESVYDAFLRASSKGDFYHDHIKDRYSYS